MTYAQVVAKYNPFYKKWIGKRVNIDGLYGYQCVDLAKQWLKEGFGIPNGAYGNAIDYWLRTSPVILKKFNRIYTSRCHTGDLVILKATRSNPYGHIGIAHKNYTPYYPYITILEQNGGTGTGTGTGTNAIRTRRILRTSVAGMLRAK
jgi:hypothetical protein